jgi:hypothetical protein
MMYSGDEDCGDDCTSGIFPDEASLNGVCEECGADLDDEDHARTCSMREER